MTSSESTPAEAYVWIWLSGATEPVVAGRIEADGQRYVFNYGRSYLEHDNAIPIYLPELPLGRGSQPPPPGLQMASSLRDASPDAWGRRVIINRLTGLKGSAARSAEFDELTYMLESGSDRMGALDFQESPRDYVPRLAENATLDEMLTSAERVDLGVPLTPELDQALQHGSSIGGARPKALVQDEEKKYIAKFSATNDTYSVVKAEFIAMQLAKLAGIDVAPVKLTGASGKDVLLIERFDREATDTGWTRRAMVSALTMLGLDEMMARYASYGDLAEIVRARFTHPAATLRELFSRLTFNILVGNNDDHARNHAAFWDGVSLTLTPAYDICPQARTGREVNQAMLIYNGNKESRLSLCLEAAHNFLLSEEQAVNIVKKQVACIKKNWHTVCDNAELSEVDRNFFWRRQVLNRYAFQGSERYFGDLT